MKFTCSKDVIYGAVTTASKAASAKSSIAVLEGLLLELKEGVLVITGYNLEIGIRMEIGVSNSEDGVTVVNAKMFTEVIKRMPNGEIDFEIDGKNVLISRGETKLSVLCMPADDFPPIPEANLEGGFTVSQKTLKSMIMQTKYACSADDSKPTLMGCLFEVQDNVFSVVAIDGVRIALREEPVNSEDKRFIVPAKTIEELVHLLADDDKREITIAVERNQISFKIDDYTMISRLITGEFLEYRKHLFFDTAFTAEIKCREIMEVLERAVLFLNEKNKSPLRLDFSGDSVNVSLTTALGRINDKIAVKYNGEPISIGFNARFLLDAFRASDSDCVKMLLTSSPVSPVLIVPMEGKEFRFLLLPMRLKN